MFLLLADAWPLNVSDKPHKAFVLMILVMAVKERRARVVGYKIDLHGAETCHVDGILHDACRFLVANFGDLKCMSVQVNWVIVAALVGHGEPVSLADFGL